MRCWTNRDLLLSRSNRRNHNQTIAHSPSLCCLENPKVDKDDKRHNTAGGDFCIGRPKIQIACILLVLLRQCRQAACFVVEFCQEREREKGVNTNGSISVARFTDLRSLNRAARHRRCSEPLSFARLAVRSWAGWGCVSTSSRHSSSSPSECNCLYIGIGKRN